MNNKRKMKKKKDGCRLELPDLAMEIHDINLKLEKKKGSIILCSTKKKNKLSIGHSSFWLV
jgi:hypothetical protein